MVSKHLVDNYLRKTVMNAKLSNLLGCPVRCSEKQMLKSPVKLLI